MALRLLIILIYLSMISLFCNHNLFIDIYEEAADTGGLAILISFSIGLIIFSIRFKDPNYALLLISFLPISLTGLCEDIKHYISPRLRLAISFISALIAALLINSYIVRTGISFLDFLVRYKAIGVIFAVIAIAGVTNAINLIDGLNGLSSGSAMLFLLAFGYVAFKVQDFFILSITILIGAAILGFFIWNYPYGRIFLGDSGAYLIGFVLAIGSILLVNRNPSVSPWFPILILIYPIFETLFSIYRRYFKKHKSPLSADFLHLHSLFYRRVIPHIYLIKRETQAANYSTSPFIWMLCAISIVPGVLFWKNNLILMISSAAFILIYLFLYKCVVSFKIGRILNGSIRIR